MRQDLARLAELRRLMVLDSVPETDYDAITQRLAAALQVPIAIVNLLDGERDWFKSCVGLDIPESPAATSFCETFFHSGDDLIVVPDTTQDARFARHPLVAGPPGVRFYAAARLAVAGHTVGTLCAYDLQPRQIAPEAVAEMRLLAAAAMELLRCRGGATGAAAP